MARHVHAQTGMKNLVPGRRRGAQLRRQRPHPARGPVREHLDSAGGGRCRRRARRRRCSSGISCSTSRARRGDRDSQHGSLLGPAVHATTRSARSSTARAPRITTFDDDDAAVRRGRRSDRQREGRRLVPGPHGVRPARARRAQHPRRRAQPDDAVDDEPEDQVPRVVPAVRAGRAAGARRRVLRDARRARTARTCCSWRRCSESTARCRERPRATASSGIDKLKLSRSTIPAITHVDYSARVQTVDAERHGRYYTLLERVRAEDRLPGDRSTPASTSAASRSSARRRTPTAASWRPNMDVLVLERPCCSRASSRQRAGEEPQAYLAHFSWTDAMAISNSTGIRDPARLRQFGRIWFPPSVVLVGMRGCVGGFGYAVGGRVLACSRALVAVLALVAIRALVRAVFVGLMVVAFPIGRWSRTWLLADHVLSGFYAARMGRCGWPAAIRCGCGPRTPRRLVTPSSRTTREREFRQF